MFVQAGRRQLLQVHAAGAAPVASHALAAASGVAVQVVIGRLQLEQPFVDGAVQLVVDRVHDDDLQWMTIGR